MCTSERDCGHGRDADVPSVGAVSNVAADVPERVLDGSRSLDFMRTFISHQTSIMYKLLSHTHRTSTSKSRYIYCLIGHT